MPEHGEVFHQRTTALSRGNTVLSPFEQKKRTLSVYVRVGFLFLWEAGSSFYD